MDEGDDDLLPIAESFPQDTRRLGIQHECKYHCSSKADYQVVACAWLSAEECVRVGHLLPDPGLLCKHCAKARPDVSLMFSN